MASAAVNSHSAKRTNLTLGLLLVFVLLIAVIGWMEFGGKSAATQNTESISSVVITRSGHHDIELMRENSQWRMSAPYSLKANAQRVEPLLSLGSAEFEGYETGEVDMAATGLNTPGAALRLGTRKIQLGNIDASGDRRYVLVDEQVSFVPEWVWSLVHGGVSAFADLAVFEQLPDVLYLHSEDDVHELAKPELWQMLHADKIVPWPFIQEQTEGNWVERARHTLSSSSSTNANNKLAELIEFEQATLINTHPGFAFAISSERMGELLQP